MIIGDIGHVVCQLVSRLVHGVYTSRLYSDCSNIRYSSDCCLFGGGGIRGSRDYPDGLFVGDLESEFPFPTSMSRVQIQGELVGSVLSLASFFLDCNLFYLF
jgi:hypothetical protein